MEARTSGMLGKPTEQQDQPWARLFLKICLVVAEESKSWAERTAGARAHKQRRN